jgi:hypothetical protein
MEKPLDDWKLEAACRGLQTNLFFPEKGDQHTLKTALEICNGTPDTEPCPVKQQCLDWILTTFNRDEDLYGIYGGLLPAQRLKLRKPSSHVAIAVPQSRIERDNQRQQALAELLNLVHEVVVTDMIRSEHQRLTKYKETISIERDQR